MLGWTALGELAAVLERAEGFPLDHAEARVRTLLHDFEMLVAESSKPGLSVEKPLKVLSQICDL
jgi:hypothetical protein